MIDDTLRSTARLGGHPFHPMLVPFPVVCFIGAFVTDLAYWATDAVLWETFSVWLILAGLVMAGIAVLAALVDLVGRRRAVIVRPVWPQIIGYALVLALSVINAFVHSRDGYTAVVPEGLILSGLVVLVLLFTGWMSRANADDRRFGVVN